MTRTLLLALAVTLAPAVAVADDNACKYATKGDNAVVQACKKGGREAAEDVMKSMVKAAKANGTAFKCVSCHEDMDSYKPKANADDDFKKLVEAANKKK